MEIPQVRPAEEEHLGIMGPPLRAAVGDTLEVHVLNNLSFPINVIPGGVSYSAADAVRVAAPGKTVVYFWTVPAQVGSSLLTAFFCFHPCLIRILLSALKRSVLGSP